MKLCIIPQAVAQAFATPVTTNRVVVADTSGSMYGELPKLRAHLKNKLPTLVKPGDSLSLLWFSGRDQFGVIFEDLRIDTLVDLQNVHAAIDRFLTPMGLTGFTQPLQEVKKVIGRSTRDAATLTFMTDGYDNQGSRSSILDACAELAPLVASAVFVEYGYYANHDMLIEMADLVAGNVVLAENFQRFAETLEGNMSASYGKRLKVTVPKLAGDDFNFVVGISANTITVGVPKDGELSFPSDVVATAYFVDDGSESLSLEGSDQQACFVVGALIQRGMTELALQLTALIGDRPLYQAVENAFSKQDYARAVALATKVGATPGLLHSDGGKHTNLQPDPDAYNVLRLLMDLAADEGNFLDISHPSFEYNPLGGHRPTAAINEGGFVPEFSDKSARVLGQISTLKFAEDRPNVSILVRREGLVTLPPNNIPGLSDEIVESFIWRNYAIIADGIVNMNTLPVIVSAATFANLKAHGVFPSNARYQSGVTYTIDLTKLPVINRNMTKPVTLEQLFTTQHELYKQECLMKVAKLRVEKPAVSALFAEQYGDEGAALLKECGVTPGGFSPRTEKAEVIDPRMARLAEIKMSGLNTIPSVGEVRDRITIGKKLTPAQRAVANACDIVDELETAEVEQLIADTKTTIAVYRDMLVMAKFGIILSKKLPSDMVDIEDTTREMNFGYDKLIKCQFVMTEKEI